MDIQQLINEVEVKYWPDMERCIKLAPEGLCCEFGVADGRYGREIAKILYPRILYGFDSFEGLPEDWENHAPKGSFKCDPPADYGPNTELVMGLFQKTLDKWKAEHWEQKVAFIHMDADLYSSTKYVLETMGLNDDFADGCVIAFDQITRDDFAIKHEGRALQEFADFGWYDIKCIGRQKRDGAIFQVNKPAGSR